jgi:capsular polysaccharide biosynthesis protein
VNAPAAISTIRALKHYPDDPEKADGPKRLRDDLLIWFVTPRTSVTLPDPLPGDCRDRPVRYAAGPLVLAELRNGAVMRDGSYVFTERNELLRESVDRLSFVEKLSKSRPNLETELGAAAPEPSPETVAVLGAQRTANYFHWWIDVVAKCWRIHNSPYRTCHLVTPPLTEDFQRDSLRLLGLHTTPVTRPLQRFQRTISVRGLTSGSSLAIVPEAAEFARWCRAKLGLPPSRGSRKLFLSRRRARTRSLVNEDEILTALGADFELIELETMSMREQVLLFSQASAIAAPHGAGLTNILFCTQPTTVLELVHDESSNTSYRQLSGLLGHPYIGVGCEPVGEPQSKPGKRDMKASPSLVAAAAARLRKSSILA